MEHRLLLDVIVRESATVFELLVGEDESLLICRDAFHVLDLCLDVFDCVGWLNVENSRLTGGASNEDTHGTTRKAGNQVKSSLHLDAEVRESAIVFEHLAYEAEALMMWRDA